MPPARCWRRPRRHRADRVLDLSDEPVLSEERRLWLAATRWRAGIAYARRRLRAAAAAAPSRWRCRRWPLIGTGKRVGKTAVSATPHGCCTRPATRWWSWRWAAAARPSRSWYRPGSVQSAWTSCWRARGPGMHAASDFLEDAVLAGVPAVGARRCGGGLAGGTYLSNAVEAAPAGRVAGAAAAAAGGLRRGGAAASRRPKRVGHLGPAAGGGPDGGPRPGAGAAGRSGGDHDGRGRLRRHPRGDRGDRAAAADGGGVAAAAAGRAAGRRAGRLLHDRTGRERAAGPGRAAGGRRGGRGGVAVRPRRRCARALERRRRGRCPTPTWSRSRRPPSMSWLRARRGARHRASCSATTAPGRWRASPIWTPPCSSWPTRRWRCVTCLTTPRAPAQCADRGHPLPFSKGRMATTLFLSGFEAERAYQLAQEIEREVREPGADEITLDELHGLVEDVLGREDGPADASRATAAWQQVLHLRAAADPAAGRRHRHRQELAGDRASPTGWASAGSPPPTRCAR